MTNIKARVKEILTHRVTADVAVLFLGRIVASALSIGIGIIIGRLLGPAAFGRFSIAMVIFGIAVVFAEMGLGMSLVRFVPLYFKEERSRAEFYLQTGFWTILSVSIIVSIVGLFLAHPIAVLIYDKPQLVQPIRLAFIAVVGGILWSYSMATMQARELFRKYAFLNILINILKLGFIAVIYYMAQLTVENVLYLQIIVPMMGFVVGMFIAPVKLCGVRGNLKEAVKELIRFGKWVFVIDVAVSLFSRVDILFLGYYVEDIYVGLYSAAYNFIYGFTILTSSVSNVLLPKVAQMTTIEELSAYTSKILKITLQLSIFLIPGFFLIGPVIKLTFGPAYTASSMVFRIMFIGSIFNFIVEPVYLVVYALNRPQLLALVAIFKLIVSVSANYILIPMFQANGAAFSSVLTHILGGCFALTMINGHIKKQKAASQITS